MPVKSSLLSFPITEEATLFSAWVAWSLGARCSHHSQGPAPEETSPHHPGHYERLRMALKMKSQAVFRTQPWIGSLQAPTKVQAAKILLKYNLRNWGLDGQSPNSVLGNGELPARQDWVRSQAWKGQGEGQERYTRCTHPWSSRQASD